MGVIDFVENLYIIQVMRKSAILSAILLISCGLSPNQKATKILQDGVNDKSVVIRVNAAKGLILAGNTQGVKVLYEILRGEDKNGIVAALAALYDLKENTYSPVIVTLTKNTDPLIRAEAYKLISLMRDEQCREVLTKGVNDKVAKIRRVSYRGLANFKEKRQLLNGLRDIDPLVRITAAKALASIGVKDLENFVRKEMKVVNIGIWKQGIIALAEMGDTSAVPFIKDSLVNAAGVPMELKLAAAEALLILNDKDGISVLKDGLESNNPFMRVKVVQILKKHMKADMLELLAEATKDEYINVSIVALEILAEYRAKEYRDLFIKMMDAPNPLLKITAAAGYLRSE